ITFSSDMGFFFSRLLRYVILFFALYSGTQYVLKNKGYNFSPKEFKTLAERAKGEGISTVAKLAADLQKTYGPLISNDLAWNGFQAGGMQLKALVLHGGITEFIVAFHAPFATTGRSGIHFANSTCTVLSGSVQRVSDIATSDNVETFAAGGNFRQTQFESSLFSIKEKSVVVCYGRGFVPFSSLWALPQNILGGDIISTGRFHYFYLRNMYESLAHSAITTYNHAKKTYLKSEL
ncbi:hypothetical protein PENTCL1PPCAC_6529, partial [Pristionchus entomophagus]